MTDAEMLTMLKIDLQISSTALDTMLSALITQAQAAIAREGITLTNSVEDDMLVVQYAAYVYRQRRDNTGMPRFLRWMLNNRLISEKGAASDG